MPGWPGVAPLNNDRVQLAEDEEVSMEKSIIRFHKGTGAETSNT